MEKPFLIKTGAEMCVVDLAITSYLKHLYEEGEDSFTNRFLMVFLKRIKTGMERCMVDEWDMSIGKELQLEEQNQE